MTALTHIPRRRLLGTLAALVAVVGLASTAPLTAALPSAQQIAFSVVRDGEPLGHHRVFFRREAGDLHVEVDIELQVKLAFITVFRYRHKNHEVWRGGRLVAIDTETDDDGDSFWLRGRATEAGFEVEGSSGRFTAPADVMPTSYWDAQTVAQTRLLDTQRGKLIEVEVVPAEIETVTMAGLPVPARRYKVDGDLVLDLWYTEEGQWAKTKFEARGAEVIYTREVGAAIRAETGGSASEQ